MPMLGAFSDGTSCVIRLATSALIKKLVSKLLHASQMRLAKFTESPMTTSQAFSQANAVFHLHPL
jgi:hypothetical protein